MPKATEFKRMSKAQQAEYLKQMPRATPVPRPRTEPRVGRKADAGAEETPRDGLAWLLKKKRISAEQARAGLRYRAGFREDGGEVMGVGSCLEVSLGGSGDGKEMKLVATSDARREYLLIVGSVLWHDAQLVAVMDGICGHGYTPRYLAGGKQVEALEVETALKVALNLVIAWKAAHAARVAA
jgi:hypothetical protein